MTPLVRLAMIRKHAESYRHARRILRENFTSVAERKAAISIRDEFVSAAPAYVDELVTAIDALVSFTDGEECADPELCNAAHGNPVWLCSRCRLREVSQS